ncbi:N-acetyltransferase [Staphylococcus xylosus]|uniref:GNAT family N-acetyltransferase n=1 Tax=Staphylococcus xylosus TaxID=1288 RepID=UPI000852BAAC|nr:GNAT family N-acetyltransferase [Staphylococcus xylosus]MBF0810158.1 GNAT family N-acetyltransferase [Staphylococcus xylosus]MBO3075097.1 GNAT family N-acetyltransferase [Staphylococcus xylosus]MBV5141404.1 GNAT family N-acetyltransferase [Staphylococcus xylosus]MBW3126516.1 GNAT family N-acetyltransferase [Staphylococcus xylosus]MCR1813947.1 GNAT family N-acetyltransferase [Staphylococcus xylosus]
MDKNLWLHFTTQRLIIRPLEENDYESWLRGFVNRKPSQYKHDKGQLDMSDATEPWFAALVTRHQEAIKSDDLYIFGIFDKAHNHLGMLNIKNLSRGNFQWAEIGYFIHNQHWHQGFAYEALTELIKQCRDTLKFHRVEAHINIDNPRSVNLIEKVGFQYECVRKGFIFENGQWTDHYVYYLNTHDEILKT